RVAGRIRRVAQCFLDDLRGGVDRRPNGEVDQAAGMLSRGLTERCQDIPGKVREPIRQSHQLVLVLLGWHRCDVRSVEVRRTELGRTTWGPELSEELGVG